MLSCPECADPKPKLHRLLPCKQLLQNASLNLFSNMHIFATGLSPAGYGSWLDNPTNQIQFLNTMPSCRPKLGWSRFALHVLTTGFADASLYQEQLEVTSKVGPLVHHRCEKPFPCLYNLTQNNRSFTVSDRSLLNLTPKHGSASYISMKTRFPKPVSPNACCQFIGSDRLQFSVGHRNWPKHSITKPVLDNRLLRVHWTLNLKLDLITSRSSQSIVSQNNQFC